RLPPSAGRALSSPSARRSSRDWPVAARSSPPASADRLSSSRRTPASSSTRATRPSSRPRSAPPPSFRARTPPPARPPSGTESMSRRAGWRRSSSKPLEIGEPNFHQRSDRILETRLARGCQRLLVALSRLREIDALLEAIVAGNQELLDSLAGVRSLHARSLAAHIYV